MALKMRQAMIPLDLNVLGEVRPLVTKDGLRRGKIELDAWQTQLGMAKLSIWVEVDPYFPGSYRYSALISDPQVQRRRPKTALWLAHAHTALDEAELEHHVNVCVRGFETPLATYGQMPYVARMAYENHLARLMAEDLDAKGYEVIWKSPGRVHIDETMRFHALEAGYVPVELECVARSEDRIGTIRVYHT